MDDNHFLTMARQAGERVRTMAWDKRRSYDQLDADEMVKLVTQDMQKARDFITEGFSLQYAVLMLIRDGNVENKVAQERLNKLGKEMGERMTALLADMERISEGVRGMKDVR